MVLEGQNVVIVLSFSWTVDIQDGIQSVLGFFVIWFPKTPHLPFFCVVLVHVCQSVISKELMGLWQTGSFSKLLSQPQGTRILFMWRLMLVSSTSNLSLSLGD